MTDPRPFPSRNALVLLAAGGSAAMLAFALASQYGFGLWPCPLCLWQRWPHGAAVLAGAAALALPGRVWPLLGAAAALVTAGIGVFHAGVEQGWWQGLQACSAGPGIAGLSAEALLNPAIAVPAAPRCDEIAFAVAGLSMAAWNAILSAGLAGVWLAAARRG